MSLPPPTAAELAALRESKIENFTLLAIATVFVILRTVQRSISVGIKKFMVDDYLMIFALVCYALETAAAYEVGNKYHGLANNGMTSAERASLSPDSLEYSLRVGGSKLQVIGWNVYSLILWSLKMCMCIFYARLTAGLDHMLIRVKIGYVAIAATYVAVVLSILTACHPLYKNWQINPDPGTTCQPAISPVNCLVVVVLNVLTDMYLMSIPLPLLFKAQMPMKRKALLLFMFSGGVFVMACGILRAVLILINPVTGAQEAGSWAVRETFVAVIVGNLPMVYKLFRIASKQTAETIKSYRGTHVQLEDGDDMGKHGVPTYGYGARSGPASQLSRKSRKLGPLGLRSTLTSESDEDLQLEAIKEHGVVMTTELSVEQRQRAATPGGSRAAKSPNNGASHIAQLREQLYTKP